MRGPAITKTFATLDGPDQIDIEVGLALRRLRKDRGLSQSDLGSALGVTFQQIQKYERGTNRVSASMLVKASRVLKVRAADILPPDDAPPAPEFAHQFARVRGVEELVAAYCLVPGTEMRRALLQLAKAMGAEASEKAGSEKEPVN